jgi:pimeloyl-ACP methyl ester carboxylesterase
VSDLATVASLHPLVGLAQMLGVGLVAAWLLMVVYTVRSLTRPPRRTYTWAVSRRTAGDPGELEPSRAFEAFVFRGRAGELPAWRVIGDDPAGPVVVMTHGWGSSRVGGLKRVHAAAAAANAVVLWDLPGHGEAPGTARLGADEHLDLLALLDSLPPGKAGLVLFGWSMGAGVSIRAAAEDAAAGRGRIRAVIAEAPYIDPSTPARAVMRLRGMPHRLNLAPAMAWIGLTRGVGPRWAGFDRDAHAARLGAVPLTVIHGDADPVCPVDAGRAIAAAAPSGRLVIVPGAGHNDLWTDDRFKPAAARAVRDAVRSDRGATGAGVL